MPYSPSMCKISLFSPFHATVVIFSYGPFDSGCSNWHEMIPRCGFYLHFLDVS